MLRIIRPKTMACDGHSADLALQAVSTLYVYGSA